MFKNYLKIAFRNIIRHKAFAAINIAGLAIGMACSIFIFLWVRNELSYDRFHKNALDIYRITGQAGDFNAAVNCAGMPPALKTKYPVVKNFVRVSQPEPAVFETGTRKFEEENVLYADSTFLQVFSFPLLKGDANSALMRPDAVLITEDIAKKYFGKEEALGKTLKKNNGNNVTVTGILANIPANSHLQFDFVLPLSGNSQTYARLADTWGDFNYYSYIQLTAGTHNNAAALQRLTTQVNNTFKEHMPVNELKVDFRLQALTDIHLRSHYQVDISGHGNIQYVNIFFVVAIFILVIACINFMNLATARSARRAKEVGLRKVVGAGRRQLVGQFMGESLFISFLSLIIAVGLVKLLMPAFNTLAGKTLAINLLDGNLLLIMTGIALFTGLVSGSYPSLFLSGFKPIKVLKGNLRVAGGNRVFRNTLVVVQFVVSIVLLAGTAIVYRQLTYIKNMNLGFNRSNLLYMPMKGQMWDKQQAFKAKLKQNPLTADYTITNNLPVNLGSGTLDIVWEGKDPNKQIVFPTIFVDDNFFNVFDMKLLSGRSFSPEYKADTNKFILNEKAVQVMGMKVSEAVGKPLQVWETKGTIIGVVKNFNYKPIQNAIEPMIIGLNFWGGTAVVRTQPGKTEATIKALQAINAELNPAYPFTYGFVDQDLDQLYKGEQRIGSLFNVFAILAIFISCMGLYGLSAFMAEQRTKEIGVRKVLGASVFNVMYLLSTSFTRLILIAMAIAIPVAWYATNSWLESFAYRVNADWVIFLAASLAALLIAWITVSYESIKAALANPVKSLRTE